MWGIIWKEASFKKTNLYFNDIQYYNKYCLIYNKNHY